MTAPGTSAASVEPRLADGLRAVLANAASLLSAYVLPRVFTFAAVVLAARVLGVRDFGAYGTAAAFAVVLSIVSSLGMVPLLVREIARRPSRAPRLVRAAHWAKAGSSVLMLAALWGLGRSVLDFPAPVLHAALALGIGYAVQGWVDNLSAYFQAVERMHVWTQASAAFGLVSGAAGAVLVVTTGSLVAFACAFALGQSAALAWLLRQAPPEVRVGEGGGGAELRALLKALVPFASAFVLLTAYYKVDVLLLARWHPPEEVGVYAAAYKFVDLAQALVIVAAAALYPRLSRSAPGTAAGDAGAPPPRGSGTGARRGGPASGAPSRWAGARAVELLLVAVVPAAGALWLAREAAVQVVFGRGYGGSTAVLALLAPALAFLAVNVFGGYLLGAARRMGLVAALYGGALVFKTALDVALVPGAGATGAAVAMLVSEGALALGFGVVMAIAAGVVPGARPLALALAAAGLAVAAAALAPHVAAAWAGPPGPGGEGAGPAAVGAWGGLLTAAAYLVSVTVLYAGAGVLPAEERRALGHVARRVGRRGGRPDARARPGDVVVQGSR